MIQVVHDKIVDFCGVTKIPCVIVGSKSDLTMQLVACFTSNLLAFVPSSCMMF